MAVLLMETDAFEEAFKKRRAAQSHIRGPGRLSDDHYQNFRRPLGLSPKFDGQPQPAYMMVTDANGNVLPLYDDPGARAGAKNPSVGHWTSFGLQSVDESRREKIQLVETFGDAYTFFYGEHARVINCSGVLVNSESHNWRASFWQNYEEYFRGTKLVERNARIYLAWDDIIVQGYMLSAQARETADQPHMIPFSFSLLIIRYDNISMSSVIKEEVEAGDRAKGSDRIRAEDALASRNAEFATLLPTDKDRQALRAALEASGADPDQINGILQAEGASPALLNRLALFQADRGFLSRFGDALLGQVSIKDMIGMAKGLAFGSNKQRGNILANMGVTATRAAEQAGSSTAGAALPYVIGAKGMAVMKGTGVGDIAGATGRKMFGFDGDGNWSASAFAAGTGGLTKGVLQDTGQTKGIR